MLNKDQSKKWNSWKYSLVVPALVVFMLYFQVQMVAQEKEAPKVMVIAQDGIEVVVNKNSSDADLKNETEKAKKEGISLKFSKVKRNSEGEITAIKAEFKDKNGKKGITQVSSDEPIKPIHFYKSGDKIGFGQSKNTTAYIKKIVTGGDEGDEEANFSFNFGDIEVPEAPEAPEVIFKSLGSLKELEDISKSFSFTTDDSDGHKTIIIDGEIINVDPEKILSEIDPKMIQSIKILSSDDMVNGVKRKDGVIYIDTKKITKQAMKAAEEGIKKARIEIERAKPEIERAKKEIELSKPEMERAKDEMKQAKAEMELAKAEWQKAKVEIEKAKAEIEKAKAEFKKDKDKK